MCRTVINVSGDLVVAVLMDQWVGGNATRCDEINAEQERGRIREMTGEDVLTMQ